VHPQPEFALEIINRIWQSAEDTCELAAARSRLLLGKLPSVKRGPVPPWFDSQVATWDEEDSLFVSPAALSTARNVIGAIHAVLPDARADVSVGMLGRVLLDWQSTSCRTRWMIEATDSCWPAVRIYEAREDEQQRFVTSIKHNMLESIESLREVLG